MSGPDDGPLVVAIAPLAAEAAYDRDFARRNYLSFRELPWLVAVIIAYMTVSEWTSFNALFFSPPPREVWTAHEGTVAYSSGTYSILGKVSLSCAPGLASASGCGARYAEVLDSQINWPVRAYTATHVGWLGPDNVLVRLETSDGRYVEHSGFRLTAAEVLRHLLWFYGGALVLTVLVCVPGALERQRADRDGNRR